MTRQSSSETTGPRLASDTRYSGTIKSVVKEPSKNAQYPDPQLKVVLVPNGGAGWGAKNDGKELIDYMSLKLGMKQDGTPSKLRQLLNAIAEKDRATELWFDSETLEWGYDMREGSAPFLKLAAGQTVDFRGENVTKPNGAKLFKIGVYRAVKTASEKDD